MDYKLYKFRFQTAVHFGRQNLDEGEYSCCADTIFSALCQEALGMGKDVLQRLYAYAKEGKILLSDGFPYMGDSYYLPRPMKRIERAYQAGDSVIKKAYKKLKYVPAELLDSYLKGEFDILKAPDLERLGRREMKDGAAVRGEEETLPYNIGIYYYHEGNGLYMILGYEEEKGLDLVEGLLESLSFSGIGGKRASGLGRFCLHTGKMPDHLRRRLEGEGKGYMSLSVSLPGEEELENALEGAEYLLCKRSGFVASEQYAPDQMRKRDLYVFRSGSCFSSRFRGDVYDVSGKGGTHPVYRYARPMFMEVDA